jgi:hypothetical protein
VRRLKLSIATLATVALLGTLGVGGALAASATIPLHNNSAVVGTPDQCPRPPLQNGVSYWHFVVNPNNGTIAFVQFHLNVGGTTYNLGFIPNGSQTDNVFVAVPAGKTLGDLLIAGSTADVTYPDGTTAPTRFVLSHLCPGQGSAVSNLVTQIHRGADDVGGTTVVANGAHLPLGSSVHDSATLTSTPDVLSLPAGSSVTFYFYGDKTCDESSEGFAGAFIGGPDAHDVGTMSTAGGLKVDPALPKGPLAPGDYSYRAFFESGNTDVILDATAACEPFTIDKGDLQLDTDIHNAAHANVTNTSIALGSVIHDTATLSGAVAGFDPDLTKISFAFYSAKGCDGIGVAAANTGTEGSAARSVDSAPLGPGDYGYVATFAGDDNYNPVGPDECEPVHVNKGDLRITTDIHNAAHAIVLSVPPGSVVHDTATLSGAVAGFNPDMTQVSFAFSTNGTCVDGVPVANTGTESTFVARSADSAPLASGVHSYSASFAGDANYNPAGPAACEPLGVFQLGKTMGFWGNKNGQARIIAAGGYAVNAVNLGRGAVIDTQAESLKILPNSLNACGKGTPFIFTVGAQTISANCTLATGINLQSLNVLSAQTLALGYNIKLVGGYSANSIGGLSCTPVGSLTTSSSVTAAFNAAVALIDGSAAGGTTTQSQIGDMNKLLGCLNRET